MSTPNFGILLIVMDCGLDATKEENSSQNDMDVIGVTEAVVARAHNNYATCGQIEQDIREKYGYDYKHLSSGMDYVEYHKSFCDLRVLLLENSIAQ